MAIQNRKRKNLFRVSLAVGVWLGAACVGYGLDWVQWPARARTSKVLDLGGRNVEGKVLAIRTWGLGASKDYFFEVEGPPEPYQAPSEILQGMDLDDKIKVGDTIRLYASGGEAPVILELDLKTEGGYRRLLEAQASKDRFRDAMRRAPEIGHNWVMVGIGFWVLSFAAWAIVRRRESPR